MVEKVAQDVLTQPLKTLKSSVWCTRNTSFQLSSFAATWLEKCPQVTPIKNISATKAQQKHFPRLLQKPTKKTSRTTPNCYENCVLFGVNFWVFFYLLALCSDLGFPSPPKRSPDPKKVTKRHPTSDKINSKMTNFPNLFHKIWD